MASPALTKAFEQAVAPGPDRLLAGVALAAAGVNGKDASGNPPDYFAAFGTTGLDPTSQAVSTDTVVWLASCTKLLTAIAALQCVERGLFTLDDPADVDRLLPEWKNPEIILSCTEDGKPELQPAKEKITLRRLLTHTSGLIYDVMNPNLLKWWESRGESGPKSISEPILDIYTHPLIFEPGTAWAYGPSVDVAGLMVARANNCTLEEYMRPNIFNVLGMSDTCFHPKQRKDIMDRLMPMSTRSDDKLVEGYPTYHPFAQPLDAADELGGVGVFSTATDYLKVLKAILRNDGTLLRSDSVDHLFKPSLSEGAQAALQGLISIPPFMPIRTAAGEPPSDGVGEWSYSFAGLVGLHQSEDGFEPGWIQWGGGPGLRWWIDRKGGTCGFFATQLEPMGEPKHVALSTMFMNEMLKHFSRQP